MAQREGFVCEGSREEAKVDSREMLGVEETKVYLKKLVNLGENQSRQNLGGFG